MNIPAGTASNPPNMSFLTVKTLGVTALGTLVLAGCVVREEHVGRRPVVVRETVVAPAPVVGAEVVVAQPPPPPQVEVIPVAPSPAYIWIGGAWAWHGRWVWEGGHYALPPRHGAVWVPHHYEKRGNSHVWIAGGWR